MALVAVAVLAGALAAGCKSGGGDGGGSPSDSASPVDSELAEIYAQIAEAMTQEGQVYHFRIEGTTEAGELSNTSEAEYWIDVENEVARQDLGVTDGAGAVVEQTTFVVGDEQTTVGAAPTSTVAAAACPGLSAAASFFLSCGDEVGDVKIEEGEFEGTPARILTSRRLQRTQQRVLDFTQTTYLDLGTLLPLAAVLEGTVKTQANDAEAEGAEAEAEEITLAGTSRVVEDDFVDRESLPDDHFVPAEPEPQATPTPTPEG